MIIAHPALMNYNVNIAVKTGDDIMYDEKAKAKTIRYLHSKREGLYLNLPLGTKDLWKDYAADLGISVTQLITQLMEQDMKEHNWTKTLNPYIIPDPTDVD